VPRNVEVKARVIDLAEVEARARRVATDGPVDIAQDDTFFACPNGRLKLRQFANRTGELIHYLRENDPGPKVSEYWISPVESPDVLRESLARALGVVGRVRKRRRVYLVDRTRVHLDVVEGLGCFVELEVVLAHGESPQSGEIVARDLMSMLGIGRSQWVEGAYLDLQPECATELVASER
jgi:predicted adenylyl cyclase CyaB